jgi:hypothetical protein
VGIVVQLATRDGRGPCRDCGQQEHSHQ